MLSRDIRLTDVQLIHCRDMAIARARVLRKRLEASSYDGKPNMKDAVIRELRECEEISRLMEHNRAQLAREFANRHFANERGI